MRTKILLSGLTLFLFHLTAGSFLARLMQKQSSAMGAAVPSFITNIVLPLLSSACCSIQLIVNVMASAGGCAGFNSYLGPVRPYFFSLLVYLTILSRRGMTLESWIRATIFRFSLALLPEVVHVWNNYLARTWTSKKQPSMAHGQPQPSTSLVEAQIELNIPTMGCVACINKIDSSIRSTAPQQIVSSESWLDAGRSKGGNAAIRLSANSKEEVNAIADAIVRKVQAAGFETCRVESIHIEEPTKPSEVRLATAIE